MGFTGKTVPQARPEKDALAKGGAVFRNTHQHQMVTLLSALSALGEYAAALFQTIAAESSASLERSRALAGRLESVRSATEIMEKNLMAQRVDVLLQNPSVDNRLPIQEDQQLFNQECNLHNPAVKTLYEAANPPPNLAPLDALEESDEPALKKYTNPGFFFEAWLEEQLALREAAKQERRARRQVRRAEKTKNKRAPEEKVEVKKMLVAKFDPITGEKILVDSSTGRVETAGGGEATASSLSFGGAAVASHSDLGSAPNTKIARVSMTASGGAKKPAPMGDIPPPPPDIPGSDAPRPPVAGTTAPRPPAAPAGAAPLPPPGPAPATVVSSTMPAAPAPPPAPGAPPAPAPPSAPPAPAPPAVSPLAAALAGKSANLKKAEAPAGGGGGGGGGATSSLLDSIRAGTQLKKVESAAANVKKPEEDRSVASILARRIAIAGGGSSSEEEEDDWDDEWD